MSLLKKILNLSSDPGPSRAVVPETSVLMPAPEEEDEVTREQKKAEIRRLLVCLKQLTPIRYRW